MTFDPFRPSSQAIGHRLTQRHLPSTYQTRHAHAKGIHRIEAISRQPSSGRSAMPPCRHQFSLAISGMAEWMYEHPKLPSPYYNKADVQQP